MPAFEKLSRTPGATLIDLRIRNPMTVFPSASPHRRAAARALRLLAGDAVLVSIEPSVVRDRLDVEAGTAPERRHRRAGRPVVRTQLSHAVPVSLVEVAAVLVERRDAGR